MSLKYVDLFAGCGGLSLGLERHGFELALAVEKSDLAARTFCYNFIDKQSENTQWWNQYLAQPIETQAKSKLVISPVGDVVLNKNIINQLKTQNIDLIAGGPPCQGFSMAGKRQKSDPRNKLVWDFLNFVSEINPRFVIIENVLGINRSFEKGEATSFEQLRTELDKIGYNTQGFEVNAKNYGVPQNRPRMIIFGVRKDIASQLNIEQHFLTKIIKDTDSDINPLRPVQATLKPVVADALSGIDNNGYNGQNISAYALSMSKNNTVLKNQHVRKHSDKVLEKFRLIAWLHENNHSIKLLRELTTGNVSLLISNVVNNIQYPAKLKNNTIIAHSKEEFSKLILSSASKKQIQRLLELDKVAPTVMSASDDLIHPIFYRGLTVREMARLQSFPDNFIFLGKETTGGQLRKVEVPQYTQVGNAVPPLLAEGLAKMIVNLLK